MKTEQDFKVSALNLINATSEDSLAEKIEYITHELYEAYKLGYEDSKETS